MISIILGLIGLSIVVIFHEFGHFVFARLSGIEVEAFSVGWGPSILSHKGKKTEWKLCAFPIGGYCKLKGEEGFQAALDQNLQYIPSEKGSFFSASPLKRIFIASAGPLFSVLFAAFIFILAVSIGTTTVTAPNKIILSSEIGSTLQSEMPNPADIAGLKTGDKIISIDGKEIRDYSDLQEIIAINPGKTMSVEVLRNGEAHSLLITPRLDPNTGVGVIGVYAWIDPIVESVQEKSPAAIADLHPGDMIIEADGKVISNTIDLMQVFNNANGSVSLRVKRGDQTLSMVVVAKSLEETGLRFEGILRTEKAKSLPEAISMGVEETFSTLSLEIKSIGLLFRGVNVFKAISGPARLTYLIGTAASEQIKTEGLAGLVPILDFLAFISIGLAIMNLLPLPALDGGRILIYLIELIRRRPINAKSLYRYQFIGAASILLLLLIATMSDIFFFLGK